MKLFTKLFLVTALLFLIGTASGQDIALMNKMVDLEYQGKLKEAIPLMDKLANSYITGGTTDQQKRDHYLGWLAAEAYLYESTGDFSKAEQLLKKVLLEKYAPQTKESNHDRMLVLNQLSLLYEKMGNDEAARDILEEIVVSEYKVSDDRKARFLAYYMRLYKSYYPKQSFDSVAMAKKIDTLWAEHEKPGPDTDTAAMKMMDAMMNMQASVKQTYGPPTAEQINLLRRGMLKLSGSRNGFNFNDPWHEIQRLFWIYRRINNNAAAEGLIKQAIAVDLRPGGSDNTTGDFLSTFVFRPETYDAINKMGLDSKAMTNMKQILSSTKKRAGVDMFFIQNKVLLAQLYKETGRVSAYKLLADTISGLCKTLDSVSNPMIINSVAESFVKIENYKEAEKLYQKTISFHKTQVGDNTVPFQLYLTALQELSKIYRITGRYKDAESALQKALDFDKMTMREQYPDHLERVIGMAQLYENAGNFDLAEQFCNQGVTPVLNNVRDNFSFLSEQEKILWINTQISAFDFSASLLITNPHTSAEFVRKVCDQQLQLKGLALNDEEKILRTIHKNGDPHMQQLLAQWQSNKAAIAWQYSQSVSPSVSHRIDSLKAIANEQEKQINQLSASFSNDRQNQQVDFKQVQKQLKQGEAAIEFVRFNYYHKNWNNTVKYGAFIITPDGEIPRFISICDEAQLAVLLDKKNNTSGSFIRDLYGHDKTKHQKGDTLYNLVWQPLQPYLKGITKISIAPAGLLNRVAFSALSQDADNYLVDKYQISQYGSIRQIAEQNNIPKPTATINAVLYGGIPYDALSSTVANNTTSGATASLPSTVQRSITGGKWPVLDGTGPEVSQINKLFLDNHISTNLITGPAASEESLKQLSGHAPSILHIATHGFSLPDATYKPGDPGNSENQFTRNDDPLFRSGIIMAGANRVWTGGLPIEGKEDGIVTAYEISNIDFSNTDLVVLSACETALGDIKGTEGVFGLQRAFKYAGVKNMLLSLWRIPDEKTSQLMELFYRNKLKDMSNHEALNSAQQVMRKSSTPYEWAAFILIE